MEARRLEEKQRQEAMRAPHRWDRGKSVPVEVLETKSNSGAAVRQAYGTVEVLDSSILAQQEQQQSVSLKRVAKIYSSYKEVWKG